MRTTFFFLQSLFLITSTAMHAQEQPLKIWNLSDFMIPTEEMVYWKEIYNGETIRAGYYHLKSGASDDQKPHDFDEIYWIENGQSKIRIGTQDFDIRKGDVIFVQAKQIHYFHQITQDLDILVLFSKGPFDPAERIDQIDPLAQIQKQRDATKNVWNPFLKKKSMTFGLYMLPKSTGGDQPLTHPFDEINFVVKGESTFVAGEQSAEVRPGSLFFVAKNTPHYFKTKGGVDAFILFETKSTSEK